MPFCRIAHRELEMFYVLNPNPQSFAPATHDNLPQSYGFKEGKPTLVFIHAAGHDVTSWTRQLGDPRLAMNFNLLAMDCRFAGWTRGGERKSHTLENSAECVLALLDELNYPSYILWGEGVHGCAIAAWIAVKSKKLSGLALASPGYMVEAPHIAQLLKDTQEDLLQNKENRPDGDGTGTFAPEPLSGIASYFIGSSPRLAKERVEMEHRFQKRYGTGHTSHDVRWLFEAVWDRKAIPANLLATVKCPVLILRGSDDTVVCPEVATEEWRRSFVNSKGGANTVVISGAPSLISLSDSNVTNRILMQFAQRAASMK